MEKVLVVPANIIEPLFGGKNYLTTNLEKLQCCITENHSYIDREIAETADEYKQIIPYAVLMNGEKFFLTKRLKKQTEKRLHGLLSVGLGGHINPTEETTDNVILRGMCRELFEEVGLISCPTGACVGAIDDHSAIVSNYHIGLVFIIHVESTIAVRETQKMLGWWASEEEIATHYDELESWSKILWDNIETWRGK